MKKILLLLLILGVALFLLLGWIDGRLSSLLPGSRLAFFETRIASVEDELMRRALGMPENFQHFNQCIRRVNCDIAPILSERDALIVKNWPHIFPRLMVKNDWGTNTFTDKLHRKFLEDVQRVGGQEKAARCQPLVRYYLLDSSLTTYIYEGLRCPRSITTN